MMKRKWKMLTMGMTMLAMTTTTIKMMMMKEKKRVNISSFKSTFLLRLFPGHHLNSNKSDNYSLHEKDRGIKSSCFCPSAGTSLINTEALLAFTLFLFVVVWGFLGCLFVKE